MQVEKCIIFLMERGSIQNIFHLLLVAHSTSGQGQTSGHMTSTEQKSKWVMTLCTLPIEALSAQSHGKLKLEWEQRELKERSVSPFSFFLFFVLQWEIEGWAMLAGLLIVSTHLVSGNTASQGLI